MNTEYDKTKTKCPCENMVEVGQVVSDIDVELEIINDSSLQTIVKYEKLYQCPVCKTVKIQ